MTGRTPPHDSPSWLALVQRGLVPSARLRIRVLLLPTTSDPDAKREILHGEGDIHTTWSGRKAATVVESGHWSTGALIGSRFRNVYRFEFDPPDLSISHLRRGPVDETALVRLVSTGRGSASSVHPHLCGADRYSARLRTLRERDGTFAIRWTVRGPKKNQRILSVYG